MKFRRFAIYHLPSQDTDWARFASAWLGWDATTGQNVDQPRFDGFDTAAVTHGPDRYGLHATLKPPFRLKPDCSVEQMLAASDTLAANLAPASCGPLQLTHMGRFLALCPGTPNAGLNALAAECVVQLDPFRAPPEPSELERRRHPRLSQRQNAHLDRWGYPHVFEDFRFHITLTNRLQKKLLPLVEATLADCLAPLLPETYILADIALVGEDDDGRFHLLERFPLNSGTTAE